MVAADATDHVAETRIHSVSATSSPRKARSDPLSRTRSRSTSASAATHRSGTVAQPQALGKYPPCAPASPTTGAKAKSAGATPSGRLSASPFPTERLGRATSSVKLQPTRSVRFSADASAQGWSALLRARVDSGAAWSRARSRHQGVACDADRRRLCRLCRHNRFVLLEGALNSLFVARRPARVVLVGLVHVAVALAVLNACQDVSEQSRLAILKLAGELVQDRPLHSAAASNRENSVDMGAQRHRVAARQQARRIDEDDVEPGGDLVEYLEQSWVMKHLAGRERKRSGRQQLQETLWARPAVLRSAPSVETCQLLDSD